MLKVLSVGANRDDDDDDCCVCGLISVSSWVEVVDVVGSDAVC